MLDSSHTLIMGGIFVYVKKMLQLLIGYICGYLYIMWIPIHLPNQLSEVIVEVVLNPVPFVASILAFFIGFLIHADILKKGIEKMTISMWKGKFMKIEILFILSVFISLFLLSLQALWPALILFCFSFLYGMLSLDYELFRVKKE
jgi:hypothetical protein